MVLDFGVQKRLSRPSRYCTWQYLMRMRRQLVALNAHAYRSEKVQSSIASTVGSAVAVESVVAGRQRKKERNKLFGSLKYYKKLCFFLVLQ